MFNFKEKRQMQKITQNLKLLTGYAPVFSSFSGSMYELELVRSAIDTIAIQCSKLNPVCNKKKYMKLLENPNKIMTTQQFIYKLVTILYCENNAFIVPIYNNFDEITGFYPISSNQSQIITLGDKEYLKYKINQNEYAEEYERVGHLRRFYYSKQFYGENNGAIKNTLDLIDTQNQGIINGIKSSACIRFIAKLATIIKPEDLKKEQTRLKEENLGADNNGGVMLLDSRYSDVQAIDSKPFIIDDKQSSQIKNNVFDYFHISEDIIQNKASEDMWNSFYEGCAEPIALQLSQVFSKLLGVKITFESSKMQFASNTTKLSVVSQLSDRGLMTINQGLEIFNMPPVEDGDKRYIRREYVEVSKLGDEENGNSENGNSENGTSDDTKNTQD